MIRYQLEHGAARCTIALDVENPFTLATPVFEGDAAAVLAVKRALMGGVGLAMAELRQVDGDGLRAWMRHPAMEPLEPVLIEGEALWQPGGWSISRHDCAVASRRLGEALGGLAAIPRRVDPSADGFNWLTLHENVAYAMAETLAWRQRCSAAHAAVLDEAAQAELRRLGAARCHTGAQLLLAFEQACSAGDPRDVLLAFWRNLDGAPT